MVLFCLIVLIAFLFSLEYPDFMFWLALTIFVDPGGYIQTYIGRSIIGGIQLWDLQFVLLMLPLVSQKIKIKAYFKYKDNRWIFNFLLIFALVYQIFIYGFLMPGISFKAVLNFLQYERLTIVGFTAIVPAYIFFRRSYFSLVKVAYVSSLTIVILFLITFTTGVPIIPIWTFKRGLGTDAMRVAMISYGYAYWFISILFASLLLKINLPNKKWIYFIALSMLIVVTLTLTRRSIVGILFVGFVVYFLRQRIMNGSMISPKLVRILLVFFLAIMALSVIAPKYIRYSTAMINSTIDLIVIGEGQEGVKDGRVEGDIPAHLARFHQSPYFGYGYDAAWYSNKTVEGGLSANDVPITAAIGMFGIVGLIWFSVYYFKIFRILLQTFKILKILYRKNIANQMPYLFIIAFILLISFIIRYTLNFMNYFEDLISGVPRVNLMINLGFLLAARDIILRKLHAINIQKIK
jgi:hypothetical protein